MAFQQEKSAPPVEASGLYRLFRGLVRFWFALSFRRIRVLRGEEVPVFGPVLLLASHPGGFLDALILIAAFERRIHCALPRGVLSGPLRRLLARGLGMTSYELGPQGWAAVCGSCLEVLANQGALAMFVDLSEPGAIKGSAMVQPAAALALQAESRASGHLGLQVFPLHLDLPVERSQSRELLVYIDRPLLVRDHLPRAAEDFASATRSLADLLAVRCRANAFRLQEEDLRAFLGDLENILRANLQESWASRKNWKQNAEGFELSGFVEDWAEQLNYLNPGKLVSLREDLKAAHESRRQWSQAKFEVENAGAWAASVLRRAAVWFETLVGSAIAAFGLVNHLVILLILAAARVLRTDSERDARTTWLIRALVVLGCYALQVLLCADVFGRAAAGYYAPALPLSGAYLWRYRWLLRHRTRPAYLHLMLGSREAGVRRQETEFVQELDGALKAHAALLRIPH